MPPARNVEMPPPPTDQNVEIPPDQNFEMPPPPPDQIFRTEEEATDFIDDFTSVYGYALVTKTSKRDPKDAEISVRYLRCDRGGIYTPKIKEEDRKRQTTTRCDNCPFAVVLRRSKDLSGTLKSGTLHTHTPLHQFTHTRASVSGKDRSFLT
jgi:hypothetical protein